MLPPFSFYFLFLLPINKLNPPPPHDDPGQRYQEPAYVRVRERLARLGQIDAAQEQGDADGADCAADEQRPPADHQPAALPTAACAVSAFSDARRTDPAMPEESIGVGRPSPMPISSRYQRS